MNFKISYVLFVILFSGCRFQPRHQPIPQKVGESGLIGFSNSSNRSLRIVDDLVFLDTNISSVVRLRTDPFEFVESFNFEEGTDSVVFSELKGGFYVLVSEESYQVAGSNIADGEGHDFDQPVRVAGFDGLRRRLFILDGSGDVHLFAFGEDGSLESRFSTRAGKGFSGGYTSSAFLSDGRIVVASEENSISVVDVDESFRNEGLSLTSFELTGVRYLSFMAEVPESDTRVFFKADGLIGIFDIDAKGLLDSEALSEGSGETISFLEDVPHVISRDRHLASHTNLANTRVYFPSGAAVVSKTIAYLDNLQDSYLSSDMREIILTSITESSNNQFNLTDFLQFQPMKIVRYNLQKMRPTDITKIEESVLLGFNADFMVAYYDSSLGYAMRREFGSEGGDGPILQEFNIDALRKRRSSKN